MPDPVTTTIGLAALASFLWELPKQIAFEVIGGEVHRRSLDVAERLRQRLLTGRLPTGRLPADEHVEEALRNALAGATLVFAYTFHDPDRKLLGMLASDGSWSTFSRFQQHLSAFLRNNIRREQPGDGWLSELIRLANDPATFTTFNLDITLAGDRPWGLVGQELDTTLRDHVHRQFLQWLPVGRSAFSPTPDKPADFDRCVTEGLTFEDGKTLTFYDVFRLFFRQELQERPLLHRAYVVDVLAELKTDVERILSSLPSDDERQQLQAAVDAIATFGTFQQALAQQNRELLEETRGLLAHVNLRIDYAIAGLPIRRFELPDPPERELDLLQAQYRTVTLTGRDADLDALWHWLFSAERISARLIVGGAGTGKTRLALELLLRVNERLRHWQAGLLDPDVLRNEAAGGLAVAGADAAGGGLRTSARAPVGETAPRPHAQAARHQPARAAHPPARAGGRGLGRYPDA